MGIRWTGQKKYRWLVTVAAAVMIVTAGAYTTWTYLPAEHTCRSCHEIGPAFNTWVSSAHRGMACVNCHGTALSNGLHSLREKSRMVLVHFSGKTSARLRMAEQQVLEVMERCTGCHRSEYADWLRSGHSATYASVFLDQKHNRAEKLYGDCLKCHGMYFDGNIEDLVEPLDTKGPWRLKRTDHANAPVIPCLACHQIHSRGEPAARPDYSDPKQIPSRRIEAASPLVWYDRYSATHLRSEHIVTSPLYDGTRAVRLSGDHRQRACAACHAPGVLGQVGSSDDRTPKGVHEGLACLVCHGAHSQESKQSCGGCHPAISNCRLDVNTMDTTFKNPASKHNIHFVKCTDCHPGGVPAARNAQKRRTD